MIFFRDFLPNCSYISEGREFGAPNLPKMFVSVNEVYSRSRF